MMLDRHGDQVNTNLHTKLLRGAAFQLASQMLAQWSNAAIASGTMVRHAGTKTLASTMAVAPLSCHATLFGMT